MKKLYIIFGLMISSVLMASCAVPAGNSNKSSTHTTTAQSPIKEAYYKITPQKAKEMMETGDVTVVDVRTAKEYEEKHIPGAVLVPDETIGLEATERLPDKNAALLLYCRTGARSERASKVLVSLGYTRVYDFGGIVDWPYETEGEAANEQ